MDADIWLVADPATDKCRLYVTTTADEAVELGVMDGMDRNTLYVMRANYILPGEGTAAKK